MTKLRIILGDQLTHDISALDGIDADKDIILMMEVADETNYVRHHKQKIVLILSSMRHFAEELREAGFRVDYIKLDEPKNSGSLTGELKRAIKRHRPNQIVVTEPGEWRVLDMMRRWSDETGLPVDIRDDDRFFCSRARFARWAEGRKSYRMEFFYREMRRETEILMDGDEPIGGHWNYDHDNRKALPSSMRVPKRTRFEPDTITREVIQLVEKRFATHFGTLQAFGWAVTRKDALEALAYFMDTCLPSFGDYQDAMKQGEPFLFHSVISPYLNCGLLTAREVCSLAERAYRKKKAPINAVEGLIRQVLGWREYIRGIYWLHMPAYAQSNALDSQRALPDFFWTAKTRMNCMAQVIQETRDNAYAHHIQRLMVTGNFALLAGIAPKAIEEWYLSVYADAYDWVELPNVHGMVMFADGGLLASKPYAASGAYIDRMSDYCETCAYDVKAKSGAKSCPFNRLYWNFMIENESKLARNPRMAMPYKTLSRMSEERRAEIQKEAQDFLMTMDHDQPDQSLQTKLDL